MRYEEKLRKEMLLKGFNQQKLARASGVSDSEISRILSGKSLPGLDNALKLARAVDSSLDYLADDSLRTDPLRQRETSSREAEVLELADEIGHREAAQLLMAARLLGFDVAMRRLLNAERPVIEVGDNPHATPASNHSSNPKPRANSA